jgi:vacuolar-type H+-ATPase subunit I/STV1
VDIGEFETVGAAGNADPLMRTLADAGVASEEELQQSSEDEGALAEGSLAWVERELDSAAAQLGALRDRVGQLQALEDRRERELLSAREQAAKLREARLADAVRIEALETQLAEREQRTAAIAASLAEAARALGAS